MLQPPATDLLPHQRDFYTYQIGVWRKDTETLICTRVYTGLPVLFESTPENDEPGPAGRTKAVNIFTMDKFHCPIVCSGFASPIEIIDTDFITMEAGPVPGYPEVGKWWSVQGNAQTIGMLMNKFMIYAKQSQAPAGVSDGNG